MLAVKPSQKQKRTWVFGTRAVSTLQRCLRRLQFTRVQFDQAEIVKTRVIGRRLCKFESKLLACKVEVLLSAHCEIGHSQVSVTVGVRRRDPTKLIEVVEIGKQLLMTRGALTTFSIANDLAKYFAIVPALFAATLPWLKSFDIMHLHSATSAILSAVIFNAIIIPLLIPIALRGVTYRPVGADALLRRNLLIWGAGGVIVPFVGIKIIDVVLTLLRFV